MPRKPTLVAPVPIRLIFEGQLADAIDQEAAKEIEATRSSIIRSVMRNWIKERVRENAKRNVAE